MTGPEDKWHQPLLDDAAPTGSSDRSFGLLFTMLFAAMAGLDAGHGKLAALGWAIAALSLFGISLWAPPLLAPLNRGWRWLSLQVSKIAIPVVMALLFFVVLTPIGALMRWTGRDPLRLRFEPENPSYWLARDADGGRQTLMTRQF